MQWILLGIGLFALLLIIAGVTYSLRPCSKRGGKHAWGVVTRGHGSTTIVRSGAFRASENWEVAAYVELQECKGCSKRRAFKWVDHEEIATKEVNVRWAEHELQKQGYLSEDLEATDVTGV